MRTRAFLYVKLKRYQSCLLFRYELTISRIGMHKQLTLDVIDRFIQCIAEFFEIFLVEEYFVLFVFLFSYPLALGNGDVEILLRFRGFHIKEIRALSSTHPFREDFVLIRVFQGCNYLPSRELLLEYVIHYPQVRNAKFELSPFASSFQSPPHDRYLCGACLISVV